MSQGGDTTQFTVIAEDITMGQGDLDHLLVQDHLSGEMVMELEEGEGGKRWEKEVVRVEKVGDGDEKEEVGPPSGYPPPALRRDQS